MTSSTSTATNSASASASGAAAAGSSAWNPESAEAPLVYTKRPPFKEEQVLRYLYSYAKEGDPQDVLDKMDKFGWEQEWMMNVGDVKGKVLRQEVIKRQPKVAVELGGYCGYSAVLIGSLLPPGGHLYSVEFDPLHAAIATKIIEFAGLRDQVTVLVGTGNSSVEKLRTKYHIECVDLLFVDHVKELYKSDVELFDSILLQSGSVIVADNVIYPGAPDYLEWIRNKKNYLNTFHDLVLEYSKEGKKDGIEVSIKQ